MNGPGLSRQTTTPTLPLAGAATRRAPGPRAAAAGVFGGPLQWLLEEPGWSVLRPTVDFVLLCLAVVLALGGPHATLHLSAVRAPLLALPPLTILLLYLRGLYRTRLRALILDGVAPVVSAVSVAAMAVAMIGLFANGQVPTQSIWVHAWLYALLAVGCGRVALAARPAPRAQPRGRRAPRADRRRRARRRAGRAAPGRPPRVRPQPRRLPRRRSPPARRGRRARRPVLGTAEDLDDVVRRTGVKNLIVAFSSVADARVSLLIQRCQELGIEVSVVPRMFDTINNRVGYDTVGGLPLMSFTSVNPRGLQFTLKHALDRVLAALLLIVLAPVLALTALVVRLSSPGPILYRQRRVGRDGTLFDLYKFRSMHVDELDRLDDACRMRESQVPRIRTSPRRPLNEDDVTAFEFMLGGDTAPGGVEGTDRRTLIGRILRRTSLDELPQLLNVLRGEMSIIGPRPERPEFVELFRQDIARYGDRHRVKSGITGWAQVHGLRGQTSLAERVEWDNYYIAHWSLGLDLKILALTFGALLRNAE